jgi:hypothetical protein
MLAFRVSAGTNVFGSLWIRAKDAIMDLVGHIELHGGRVRRHVLFHPIHELLHDVTGLAAITALAVTEAGNFKIAEEIVGVAR